MRYSKKTYVLTYPATICDILAGCSAVEMCVSAALHCVSHRHLRKCDVVRESRNVLYYLNTSTVGVLLRQNVRM